MAYTTIKKPSDYFNTKLYSGNGSTQNITGLDFQPDWVWIKERTSTSDNMLFDAVRGATNRVESNTTDSEALSPNQLTAFNSDGWTTGNSAGTNESGQTYASWNWLANGTGVANTDGSISSTVSANTTSGFSIATYTGNGTSGSTIGHGLTSVPSMIITKRTDSANGWGVYHQSLGTGKELYLNYDNSEQSSNFWITTPTTSVFSVSSSDYVNLNNATYVAYCFADVQGYSKFGSYVGNGSTDGTFVYTGFKPAFIIQKNASTGSTNWQIFDNKRNDFNVVDDYLIANSSGAEGVSTSLDFVSNGFKIRQSAGYINTSGDTYIYMAFAEEPLVGDNPATAR